MAKKTETPAVGSAAPRGTGTTVARLRTHYTTNVIPALTKEFGYSNVMAVPKVQKVSVNIGLGEATQNGKLMDGAVTEMSQIAGQKPIITKAKKSIAQFKLREGMAIGCMATLRGERMYEFLDRPMNVAPPRVRHFRGVSSTSFHSRPVNFSRDRLQQSGQDQGDEYFHNHQRPQRCRRNGPAEAHGHAVPATRSLREFHGNHRKNRTR